MTDMTPGMLGGLALLVLCALGLLSVLLSDDGLAMWRIRLRRYYRVGDTVTLGEGFYGRVSALGLFTTTLLTPSGERIRLGNRAVLSSPIIVHPAEEASTTVLPVPVAPPALDLSSVPSAPPEFTPPTISPVADAESVPSLLPPADSVRLTAPNAPVPATSDAPLDTPALSPIEVPAPTATATASIPSSANATGVRLRPVLPLLPLLQRSPLGRDTLRPLRAVPLPTVRQLPSVVAPIVPPASATPAHEGEASQRRWPNAILRRRVAAKPQ